MSQSTLTAKGCQTNRLPDFLEVSPSTTIAVTAFLQEERRTAKICTKQCDAFLALKIRGSGVLEDADVRQEIFNMREKAAAHDCNVLCLLSLIRYIT